MAATPGVATLPVLPVGGFDELTRRGGARTLVQPSGVSVSIALGAGKDPEAMDQGPKAGKGVQIASCNTSANSYTVDGSERGLVNECRLSLIHI